MSETTVTIKELCLLWSPHISYGTASNTVEFRTLMNRACRELGYSSAYPDGDPAVVGKKEAPAEAKKPEAPPAKSDVPDAPPPPPRRRVSRKPIPKD